MMYETTKKLIEAMNERAAMDQINPNYDSIDRKAAEFKEELAMQAWIETLSDMIDMVSERVEYLYNKEKYGNG